MPFFTRKKDKNKAEPPAPLSVNPTGSSVKRTPSNRSDRSPLTPSSLNGDIGVPESVLAGKLQIPQLLLQNTQSGASIQSLSPMHTSSRLSKTLREILHDQNGVTCFLHFMKSQKVGDIIQFWLDVQSFHATTLTRVRTHSLNSSSSSHGNLSESKDLNASPETPVDSTDVTVESAVNSANRTESTETLQESCTRLAATEDDSLNSHDPSDPDKEATKNENTDKEEDKGGGELSEETGGTSEEKSQTDSVTAKNSGLSKQDIKERLIKSIQQDAISIFTKYLSHDATSPIGIAEELRGSAIHRMCLENGQVDPDCFRDCQEFVFQKMESEYYPNFLASEFHCKHQVDVLTSGKVYLADILYNELALSYFMEFLDHEGACHLLQFWLAADNFQQHLIGQGCDYNSTQAQDDAMVLYDKYFSLQATQPLGFDDDIRFNVEGNICREGGPLPDCFAKPRDTVLRTLDQIYFPAYIQSDMYYKFLSDLVSTVQTAQDVPNKPKHRRTESDASSEHSAGSSSVGLDSIKNTLLARDTLHMKKAFTQIEDDMRIDSMLFNPDELWKRTDAAPMTLGKVDDLGQFQSLLDPEPDYERKRSSKFFKKKKEKEKEQEDMALRVAQMIINDVTTMTQTGDMVHGVSTETSSSSRLSLKSDDKSAIKKEAGNS